VSSCTALVSLHLCSLVKLSDKALRAVSCITSLTSLDLRGCSKVTAAGVQALRNTTAAPSLRIEWEPPVEVDSDDSYDSEDVKDDEEFQHDLDDRDDYWYRYNQLGR
jgi:hypothetical protein